MTSARILIVQNDETEDTPLEEHLRGLEYTACTTVSCAAQAVEAAAGDAPDVALIDLGPGGELRGLEAAERLGERFDVPVIYLTDGAEAGGLQRAEAMAPYGYVLKPVDPRQLHLSIQGVLCLHEKAMRQRQRERDLQRTNDELRRKTRIMDTILNSTRDGILAADAAGRILFANSQAEQMVGTVADMKPGELYGTTERQAKHGFFNLDRQTYVATDELPLVRALQGEATDDKDVFIRNEQQPKGIHVTVTGRTLWSDHGEQIEGGVVFFRDVSREKAAEAGLRKTLSELHAQTQLMGAVFESMDEAILVTSTDGSLIWANSRVEQLIGPGILRQRPEAWPDAYGFYGPDQETLIAAERLPTMRVLRGELLDDVELFIRNEHRPEGLHLRVRGRPLRGDRHEIQACVVVFHDITRQKRAEVELEQTISNLRSQARLMETVFESMNEAIFVTTTDGSETWANARMEPMIGVGLVGAKRDEWSSVYGCYDPERETMIPNDDLPIMRVLRGESLDGVELLIRNEQRPEGVYVSVTGRPLLDDNAEVQGGVVVLYDITERKQAAARLQETVLELRAQTRLMQTVFDNMEEGVVVADAAGNFLLTNQRQEEIVGMKLIALEPANWPATYGAFYLDKKTLFPTDELPLVRAMRGEVTGEVELFIRNDHRPDGAYVRARGRPLLDSNREVVGGVAIFSDVTKYKETEGELEQTISDLQNQAQLMETVFESISDGVVVAEVDGRLTIFNSSARRLIGIGGLEFSPDQWARRYGLFRADKETLFPTDQLPLVRAMRGKETDDLEMFVRNKHRPEGIFISVNGRPLRRNREGHGGGVITFRDVTSRKMAETELKQAMQELRDQSELMEATFNGISDGLAVVDTEGELLNVNPAGKQIAGFEMMDASEARLVRKWGTYYYPDRETLIPAEDLPLNRVIFRGEAIDEMDMFVRSRIRPDGFFVRVSARPLIHAEGGIRGGVVIFRDVTHEMLAEEALMRAFAQGRLEIIDTVLHNIGNAINSVTTGIVTVHRMLDDNRLLHRLRALADAVNAHPDDWVEYLQHDPQGQKVMPFITLLAEGFDKQNAAMVGTVARVRERANHIADIIRTQKALDSPHMSRKDIDLEQALRDAVKVLQDSLKKRGIKVELQCNHTRREFRIQESQFHQALVNLIKNSMEAIDDLAAQDGLREPPRIGLRTCVEGDFLHIEVTDNGMGIDSRNLKLVFAAGYTTKPSGSGLGLHSAANFVIGTGGRIDALSDGIGMGATLHIVLRLSSLVSTRFSKR